MRGLRRLPSSDGQGHVSDGLIILVALIRARGMTGLFCCAQGKDVHCDLDLLLVEADPQFLGAPRAMRGFDAGTRVGGRIMPVKHKSGEFAFCVNALRLRTWRI